MNTQATHTPGPWVIKGDQLFGTDGAQIYVRNLGVTIPHYPHAVADANTKLMQTAPELLEALENILCYAEDIIFDKAQLAQFKKGVVEKHVKQAKQAIARAQGE